VTTASVRRRRRAEPRTDPVHGVVTLDNAAVCQYDLRMNELVRGQPVLATENPEPAAERQSGDPDVWARTCGDREPERLEAVVDVSEQRTCAHRGNAARDRHGAHWAQVDQDPSAWTSVQQNSVHRCARPSPFRCAARGR
jgi:hypothetical protein